jgi:hypothetical protein
MYTSGDRFTHVSWFALSLPLGRKVSPILPHATIHGVGFPQRVVKLLMSLQPENRAARPWTLDAPWAVFL